jgi:hypothetical protein
MISFGLEHSKQRNGPEITDIILLSYEICILLHERDWTISPARPVDLLFYCTNELSDVSYGITPSSCFALSKLSFILSMCCCNCSVGTRFCMSCLSCSLSIISVFSINVSSFSSNGASINSKLSI